MRAAGGTSGLQPHGLGEAARSPAPDASVTEQGQLHPRVAEPALPRGRGKGEAGDLGGSEGLRATPRCWRSEVGGRRGKEREPLAPRDPAARQLAPGAQQTDALLSPSPRTLKAGHTLLLHFASAVPVGPERAAGSAQKAVVTPKRGFGHNL